LKFAGSTPAQGTTAGNAGRHPTEENEMKKNEPQVKTVVEFAVGLPNGLFLIEGNKLPTGPDDPGQIAVFATRHLAQAKIDSYNQDLARIGVPPESRFFLAERMVTTLITEFGPATE